MASTFRMRICIDVSSAVLWLFSTWSLLAQNLLCITGISHVINRNIEFLASKANVKRDHVGGGCHDSFPVRDAKTSTCLVKQQMK